MTDARFLARARGAWWALRAMFAAMALLVWSMPTSAAPGPCLPSGIDGWVSTSGGLTVFPTAYAAYMNIHQAVVAGSCGASCVTTYSWNGSGYAVFKTGGGFNNASAGTVNPHGGSLSSDPGSLQKPPFQCASTPQETACALTAPSYSKFQYSGSVTGDPLACKNGCELAAVNAKWIGIAKQAGTLSSGTYEFHGVIGPTGKTCNTDTSTLVYIEGDEASKDQCAPHGANLSTCYNPQTRKICTTSPRGNKYCWDIATSSTAISQDQTESLAKATAPTVPTAPTGLVNAETAQITETAERPANGSTPSTTIYNIQYANQRGTANTGTGAGDGEGEGGACDGTGDCTNAGSAGSGLGSGDLYTPTGKTFSGVFTDYRASIENAPIVAAAEGIFTVTLPTATCPAITRPSWEFLGHTFAPIAFDWHCTGPLNVALQGVGWLMVLAASWYAFRIGFLNG